jgi:hypothetical protein
MYLHRCTAPLSFPAAGDVDVARSHLRPLLSLAAKHGGAIPELYDVSGRSPVHFGKDAPLRPELIESAFHVFTATRDHALLHAVAGLMKHMQVRARYSVALARSCLVLRSLTRPLYSVLQKNTRVRCGFASVADVTSGEYACYMCLESLMCCDLKLSAVCMGPCHVQAALTTAWTRTSSLRL